MSIRARRGALRWLQAAWLLAALIACSGAALAQAPGQAPPAAAARLPSPPVDREAAARKLTLFGYVKGGATSKPPPLQPDKPKAHAAGCPCCAGR